MDSFNRRRGGRDVFVHISAVERAGLNTLNERQHIEYEIEENRGKTSAVNLKVKCPDYEIGAVDRSTAVARRRWNRGRNQQRPRCC